jgi:hypothetical protein
VTASLRAMILLNFGSSNKLHQLLLFVSPSSFSLLFFRLSAMAGSKKAQKTVRAMLAAGAEAQLSQFVDNEVRRSNTTTSLSDETVEQKKKNDPMTRHVSRVIYDTRLR